MGLLWLGINIGLLWLGVNTGLLWLGVTLRCLNPMCVAYEFNCSLLKGVLLIRHQLSSSVEMEVARLIHTPKFNLLGDGSQNKYGNFSIKCRHVKYVDIRTKSNY